MIPLVIPPLTGLSVLVTRPQPQARALCEQIRTLGGDAIEFPSMQIEPVAAIARSECYDLTIFTSTNAVQHGCVNLQTQSLGKVAAIGAATRSALNAMKIEVSIAPEGAANSEALLSHPAVASLTDARVLIVRGRGGREWLRENLQARGCTVDLLEVYDRVPARPDPQAVAALERRWSEDPIDIVTATSGEILQHLQALLTDTGRALLECTPLLVVSERVSQVARTLGLRGECFIARGADDASLIGTLANWSTRARALQA